MGADGGSTGRPEPLSRARNRAIARLAESNAGAITHAELIAAGIGPDAIDHRVKSGLLHRRHRGVYIVGHLALAPRAEEAAALLACGPGAVLSHRSAAAVWALADPDHKIIDVTLPGRRCRPKAAIRLHCAQALQRLDVRSIESLLVTAPARTLLDFAADASPDELELAVAAGFRRKVVSASGIEGAIERAPLRRGAATLRALMRSQGGPVFTRSEAERKLLRLVRQAALPEPLVNARVCGFEVDFHWPTARLVLEVDGRAFHGGHRAFEEDRLRDQVLVAAGLRVIRVTWHQMSTQPLAVVARIAQAMAAVSA
jgi:very-short-patch-repair endonuclease